MSERLFYCQHGAARRGYAPPTEPCPEGGCVWRSETDEERAARQRSAVLNGEAGLPIKVRS